MGGKHVSSMKIKVLQVVAICLAAFGVAGEAAPSKYSEGQVWEYNNRPQDAGSLLKIQRVSMVANRMIYHVSIIGVHFARPGIAGMLSHAPVSEETLDASVTRLSSRSVVFPLLSTVDEGIVEWERAKGGVFTIPVSQIVEIADEQISQAELDNHN